MAEVTDPEVLQAFGSSPAAQTPGEVTDPAVLQAFNGEKEKPFDIETETAKNRAAVKRGLMRPVLGVAQAFYHGLDAIDPLRLIAPKAQTGASELGAATDRLVEANKTPEGEGRNHELVGELLNPLTTFGAGKVGNIVKAAEEGAKYLPSLIRGFTNATGKGAVAGATAAITQPVADAPEKDFFPKKTEQAAVGAAVGGTLSGGAKAIAVTASAAKDAVVKYITSKYPENVTPQALEQIKKDLQTDESGGKTAVSVMKALQRANELGTPSTLAEKGGQAVRGRASSLTRSGGPESQVARGFLESRDKGAEERLESAVSQYVSSGETMYRTSNALLKARSAEARPLWDKVFERGKIGNWPEELNGFFKHPATMPAFKKGLNIEHAEALGESRPFNPHDMVVDLDEEGNIALKAVPNMRVLHTIKVGLDATVAEFRNELTGQLSAEGRAIDLMRRRFVQLLDEYNPAYKAARQQWAGRSQSLDSMRLGSTMFARTPEEIGDEFANLSANDKQFYLLGLADKVREKLQGTALNGDESKGLINSLWDARQLRAVFKSKKEFEEFADIVANERELFESKVAKVGGSQTTQRFAEDATAARDATDRMGMIKDIFSLHIPRVVGRLYKLYDQLGGQSPEVKKRLAEILYDPNLDTNTIKQLLGDEPITHLGLKSQKAKDAGTVLKDVGTAARQKYNPSAASIGGVEIGDLIGGP